MIEEKYLNANEPSVKGVYRFLCAECKKHGLNPPHYNTFRNRVDSVADKVKTEKRRGRKVLRDVFRPLYGQDYHVNYPLGVVEIDHTVLDVMLVDRFERKLVGRPKVTVAIDVDTRMVFGYHVSFDAPDLLAVGMCMLNGILPKDEITKKFGTRNIWPIRGLPKSILLDNAKEFRSGGFFNFCKLYAIEMVFCPVKKPDTKPHVERFIKTLNEAIRDDLINGYVIPLAEKRRTGHDPEKHAELTIDEFETWLVHWIVDEYHQRVHDGIKEKEGVDISPQRWYEQRLEETGGCIVGAPTMPVNVNQLKFDVLPFEKRLLQRGGIKMWGLEYNASIIAEIRTQSSNSKVEHVVKYDPRDIREVYLWVEQKGRYFNIPLKNVYMEQLRINPRDPSDNPLSLQEYEHIKEAKGKKYGMPQHELAEARALRQEILDVARTKVKHAKKSRRIVEKQQINKTNATSMKIRENNEPAEELSEEEEFLPAIAMQENTDADNGFKPEIMPARYYDDDFEGDMHE
ncbi:MAG: transposase [Candidatus Lokiarchaeota archaeon]|nr:transposase [Candidatus Lokiarchaeota archaeon]